MGCQVTINTQGSSHWDGLRHYPYQDSKLYYNGVTNSCIDFVWIGLNRAGLHTQLPVANGEKATIRNFEGAVKVLENIERIRSIPAPVPDSPLNREEHNPLPQNRSWLHKRLTERDPEACAVPLVPDSLKDPAHPGHPGYCRALVAVGRMEVAEAESMMRRAGIQWLSTTHKSIEEIAAVVLQDLKQDE